MPVLSTTDTNVGLSSTLAISSTTFLDTPPCVSMTLPAFLPSGTNWLIGYPLISTKTAPITTIPIYLTPY